VLDHDRDDLSEYAKNLAGDYAAPSHQWMLENSEWEHAVQSYLACITFMDHQVGRVLDALNDSGKADDTIIVLFTDHGFHLGEKQRWAKRSLWERSTRTPLIIAAPGLSAGTTCTRPVGLIDLYPTLIELCGIAPKEGLEGQSIAPLVRDPALKWDRPAITTFKQNNHAIRSERWRYIRYADGSEELYDHAKDPHEWHNLAQDPEYANVIKKHAKWLPATNVPGV
jgi:arylsulfatase A-like enzyme